MWYLYTYMMNESQWDAGGPSPSPSPSLTDSPSPNEALPDIVPSNNREKPFTCRTCGRSFKQKTVLLQHERMHSGEKPFACTECGKLFRQQAHLTQHVRIHTGEKPFPCPFCDKSFRQKTILNQHLRTHTGEKPYVCPECHKPFRQKAILNQHYRIHLGAKPFCCSLCRKSFAQRTQLEDHFRTHLKDKNMKMHSSPTLTHLAPLLPLMSPPPTASPLPSSSSPAGKKRRGRPPKTQYPLPLYRTEFPFSMPNSPYPRDLRAPTDLNPGCSKNLVNLSGQRFDASGHRGSPSTSYEMQSCSTGSHRSNLSPVSTISYTPSPPTSNVEPSKNGNRTIDSSVAMAAAMAVNYGMPRREENRSPSYGMNVQTEHGSPIASERAVAATISKHVEYDKSNAVRSSPAVVGPDVRGPPQSTAYASDSGSQQHCRSPAVVLKNQENEGRHGTSPSASIRYGEQGMVQQASMPLVYEIPIQSDEARPCQPGRL